MRKIIACEVITLDGVIQNEEADGEVGYLNVLVESMP